MNTKDSERESIWQSRSKQVVTFFGLGLITWCFVPLSSYALYNGNPAFPEMPEEGVFSAKESWGNCKIGYQGDLVFDRRLKEARVPRGQDRQIDRFASFTNSGVFTFGLLEQLELYGNLGAMTANFYQTPQPTMRVNYQTQDGLLWGAGARAIAVRWGEVVMGAEVRYAQAFPRVEWVTLNGSVLQGERPRLIYREWQAGLSFARRVALFYPYIGLKYSAVFGKVVHLKQLVPLFPSAQFFLHSRGKVGLLLGCGLTPGKAVNLNFEIRLVDEEAVTFSGDLRF